jgi:hypothetical protein
MYDLKKQIEQASTAIATTIGQEATQVQSLRNYNASQRDRDPAKIAWASTLPIELALRTASPPELREHYGYTDEEWAALRENPVFIAELTAACDLVKQEGMSFKLKCRLQAEAMLETNWRMVHAPHSEVPANVKQRLMEATFRMAGYDSKEGVAGVGNQLNIQINLG